jgi:hypothetical protein
VVLYNNAQNIYLFDGDSSLPSVPGFCKPSVCFLVYYSRYFSAGCLLADWPSVFPCKLFCLVVYVGPLPVSWFSSTLELDLFAKEAGKQVGRGNLSISSESRRSGSREEENQETENQGI